MASTPTNGSTTPLTQDEAIERLASRLLDGLALCESFPAGVDQLQVAACLQDPAFLQALMARLAEYGPSVQDDTNYTLVDVVDNHGAATEPGFKEFVKDAEDATLRALAKYSRSPEAWLAADREALLGWEPPPYVPTSYTDQEQPPEADAIPCC